MNSLILTIVSILISNVIAITPFKLNNRLFETYPFSTIGKVYKYNLNNDCTINKQFLCSALAISSNVFASPYDCTNEEYENIYININKTDYKIDHILTSNKHFESYDNWNLLYLNETSVLSNNTVTAIDQSVNNVLSTFVPAYTYTLGYDNKLFNTTSMIVKVCNITNSKNILVKSELDIPKYYVAWNQANHIMYNKNNESGYFMFDIRKYSDSSIKHHTICMMSYVTTNYTTCISIPYLSNINNNHHKNTLNMSNYARFDIIHDLSVSANSNSLFDSECNPIDDVNTVSVSNMVANDGKPYNLSLFSILVVLFTILF